MEMLRQGEKMNYKVIDQKNIIGVVFSGIFPKTANVRHP